MRTPSATGVVFASGAWIVAWLPSLLPSGTVLQGVSAGVLAALGYGIGATLGAIARLVRGRRVAADQGVHGTASTARQRSGPRIVGYVGCLVLALGASRLLAPLESTQAGDLGAPQYSPSWAVASLIGLGVFALMIMVGRGLRRLTRALAAMIMRGVSHRMPAHRARHLSAGLAFAATAALFLGAVVGGLAVTAEVFDRRDTSTEGQAPPTSPTRSGGPESLVPWEGLGREGRAFVSGGSDAATIRSFAGLGSAPSPADRARLAVADMRRAGGDSADVWIGITTTGNGFVDPVAAQTAEEVSGGGAALVAIQYSTLPSWLAFLTNQGQAAEAGRATYQALAEARASLPPEQRPKLVLYGESLGAYGSPAPFAGMDPAEVAQSIDGALWVGPPAATNPISEWTAEGTPPQWQPVVADGEVARYAASEQSATDPPPAAAQWPAPRILVLQNPTDPVVWFSPTIAWADPGWLDAPRGPGVQPSTRWTPLLFFTQVALDLPQAVGFPSGYGHNYADALPEAWRHILSP